MAGSTNFLVFNPDDTLNTDDDATYLAEAQRILGIQNGIAKTSMHNKFYRQASVMVAALAQHMASKGYDVSDEDVNTLTEVIGNSFPDLTTDYVRQPPYVVATGLANTYAVTLNPAPEAYVDGMGVCVKINVDSTGASTLNVNSLGAKSIKDSSGNAITSGGLKSNTPYTMRYDSVSGNFIVQGKGGGGGNATAAQLLSGVTATVDSGPITGTMPNNGSVSTTIPSNGGSVSIPAGYTPGGTVYSSTDADLIPSNIVSGVNILGVTGTAVMTGGASGSATVDQVLSGATFSTASANGLTGTMPNRGAVAITPGPSSQAIAAGYHNGSGSVAGVTVPANKVLTGTTIAGTAGTMPNRGSVTPTPGVSNIPIAEGYHDGTGYVLGDSDLIASNILNGVSIFGVTGNVRRGFYATGTTTSSSSTLPFYYDSNSSTSPKYYYNVSGLSFTPEVVVCVPTNSGGEPTVYRRLGVRTNAYGTGQVMVLGSSVVYIVDTITNGFRIPADHSSEGVTWYAYA